eukprot:scaffold24099_cov19-Tisochrysis_lutea.AAC.1
MNCNVSCLHVTPQSPRSPIRKICIWSAFQVALSHLSSAAHDVCDCKQLSGAVFEASFRAWLLKLSFEPPRSWRCRPSTCFASRYGVELAVHLVQLTR